MSLNTGCRNSSLSRTICAQCSPYFRTFHSTVCSMCRKSALQRFRVDIQRIQSDSTARRPIKGRRVSTEIRWSPHPDTRKLNDYLVRVLPVAL